MAGQAAALSPAHLDAAAAVASRRRRRGQRSSPVSQARPAVSLPLGTALRLAGFPLLAAGGGGGGRGTAAGAAAAAAGVDAAADAAAAASAGNAQCHAACSLADGARWGRYYRRNYERYLELSTTALPETAAGSRRGSDQQRAGADKGIRMPHRL